MPDLDGVEYNVPPSITESRSVAQPGSATALGAVGREFESLHSDHFLWFSRYGVFMQSVQQQIHTWLSEKATEWLLQQGIEEPPHFAVEKTRNREHGDWAANIALQLAKPTKTNPRTIAEELLAYCANDYLPIIKKVEIAGPGFMNFFVSQIQHIATIRTILSQASSYGFEPIQSQQKIHLEFVSANPTGPLHVGHGRGAAFGSALAQLFRACGHTVHCEYYVNDAGRQMTILAVSVWLRYLQSTRFPSNGYQGTYITDIAQRLHTEYQDRFSKHSEEDIFAQCPADEPDGGDKEQHIDGIIHNAHALLGDDLKLIQSFALKHILQGIHNDLHEFGADFQHWFSEHSLFEEQHIASCLAQLKVKGLLYEHDGALWFSSEQFGDTKDRVVQRANGEYTYFASDIAYHRHKLSQGHDMVINIWGADHHGYIPRIKAAMQALDMPVEKLKIILVQFASLFRGDQPIPMSTRSGQFVTLRTLYDEVGIDAARFFYTQSKPNRHMDFDLELAVAQRNDNPIYYVQYAHARISQLLSKVDNTSPPIDLCDIDDSVLSNNAEIQLLSELEIFPKIIQRCLDSYSVEPVNGYLRQLAGQLHSYYANYPILTEQSNVREARLMLLRAVQVVLSNGLNVLGINPKNKM